MNKGFTILELLVASLLLGMLMTILTMVFTQSSVSWRLGSAMVSDLDDVRQNIGQVREEADNAVPCDGTLCRLLSPWDENGNLRPRICEEGGLSKIPANLASKSGEEIRRDAAGQQVNVGGSQGEGKYRSYTVNVMSGGPRNDIMDWQAIWSFPDDFE